MGDGKFNNIDHPASQYILREWFSKLEFTMPYMRKDADGVKTFNMPPWKNKTALSMKLYEYLMTAENAKIILLTGTPIINYPNEIAVLFNILRGYIKCYR